MSILYKNNYKSSSWCSFLYDREKIGKPLLKTTGLSCTTIDDAQFHELYFILKTIYSSENMLGTIAIKNNPSGRSTASGFSIAHEYGIFCSNNPTTKIGRLERTEEQNSRYGEKDEKGAFEWVNFRKHGGFKEDAPTMFFPIYITRTSIRIPKMDWNTEKGEYDILEEPLEEEIKVLPIDEEGRLRRWKWGLERTMSSLNEMSVRLDRTKQLGVYIKSRLNDEGILPLTIWDKSSYSSTSNGANLLSNILGDKSKFSYPKSLYAVIDSLKVLQLNKDSYGLDFFAGSGTTGHAVINRNREDGGNRKYILCEMAEYFNTVTKPRIEKVIYSEDWKDGKPVSRKGISQCFKYIRLEQYEDTLNNLQPKNQHLDFKDESGKGDFEETYLLRYMLDTETKGDIFNLEWFVNPFAMSLKTTKDNELVDTPVDMVETFNYLIGLNVETLRYPKDGYCVVEGYTHIGNEHTLVIWRDCNKVSNEALNEFFRKQAYSTTDSEFDKIYVNGDNTLPNIKTDEEHWKVMLIEEEFKKRMFES